MTRHVDRPVDAEAQNAPALQVVPEQAGVTVPTICRLCPAHCGVLATVQSGVLVEVKGDPENPLFKGYTCPKGRALPELHNSPSRLLHSQKRQLDGSFAPIPIEQAMDEIADRLRGIVAEHGGRSIAVYTGTSGQAYPGGANMAAALLQAIGSPMFFTPNPIDSPGKQIAASAHGNWLAGDLPFSGADTWLLVGLNPVLSKANGVPFNNPAQRLKDEVARGMKLIVVDPRRTETAKRATIHIQPRPGEDPTILAGLIHVIVAEGLVDHAFIASDVDGFDALARQVAQFTPEYVGARAQVPPEQIVAAARLFATRRGGMANCGTGPNFSQHGNLTEYLALCLATICGRWPRAGDKVHRPNVLLPAYTARAQASGPFQGWGYGTRLRVRDLGDAACGLPTAALADEILLEGEGQVRALICNGSNPMAAWPDQRRTQQAMEKLDLLVCVDVEMALTARLADYVIATKMTLETPGMTQRVEALKYYTIGIGYPVPYAQYSPRVVDPPAGSDLIEEWQFYHGIARRLGLNLTMGVKYGFGRYDEAPPTVIDMAQSDDLTTEGLYEKICAGGRLTLDEVRGFPHGRVFDVDEVVAGKEPGCTERLDVGNVPMMAELAEVRSFDFNSEQSGEDYPMRLISRRSNQFLNSAGRTLPGVRLTRGKPYNPLFMHPEDMAHLGLRSGDAITIASRHDRIPGIVEPDETLRRHVVAMYHCFGGLVEEDDAYALHGSNVGRLIAADHEYDPITGIPRMSNVAVSVSPGWVG
ncbi:anaerobic selenocysteine-containing dehydrogenase [Novosphingobium chloroacetimidivorans]|uniref:Anaerobic selenocysteine-containing dehydrogenase n=1 Tax=Novosphingobium chloroacetimidivorans TaxID=1428314 RepID=A0A7W7KCQ1_9SPHN|nr:molybdopterin-dependent oxidoreductase [Novosphingobium chloroacetimidivorans]MBB4860427.1 anaerobic selenocysteine-containing dehydrogenase [Novosphingobium chloroacetimidivorans]